MCIQRACKLDQLINTLLNFAAPFKQLISTLLRPLRDLATLDVRFAHGIAEAVGKIINGMRRNFAQVAMP